MCIGYISPDLCICVFMSIVLGIHSYTRTVLWNLELFISSFSEDRLRLALSPQLSICIQKHTAFKHYW